MGNVYSINTRIFKMQYEKNEIDFNAFLFVFIFKILLNIN